MQILLLGAVVALFLLAVPAGATQWAVFGSGTALQSAANPPGTTRLELPALHLQPVAFGMLIDTNVPLTVNPGPGGFGQFGSYQDAVQVFGLQVGAFGFSPPDLFPRLSLLVANDTRPPSGIRQDQVSVGRGTSFGPGGAIPALVTDPVLGEDLFVATFSFGRVATGTDDALPALVDSVFNPDLAAIWQFGLTNLSFQIREGSPTGPAELAALPVAFFTVRFDNLAVFRLDDGAGVIPEPATWALLITGFGLVGGALRRRRCAPA
ncbi:MAG: PEPxxWA-CTERM sorting domain-containing protein [Thermaurantiacus sp.]